MILLQIKSLEMRIRHDLVEIVVRRSLGCEQARAPEDRRGASLRHDWAWRRVSPYDRLVTSVATQDFTGH